MLIINSQIHIRMFLGNNIRKKFSKIYNFRCIILERLFILLTIFETLLYIKAIPIAFKFRTLYFIINRSHFAALGVT